MSILTWNFESQYLNSNHQVTIILPDKKRTMTPKEFYQSGKKYPVLWLLHGTFGDNTDWIRKTQIEIYAEERDLIVVMPQAQNSNYTNWPISMMGYNMFDYLTEELMPLVYGWLPASDKREDNFIAGLSMGGRGTIKFAVNHPDKFAAAAVLSAAPMDWTDMKPGNPCPLLDSDSPRMRTTILNAGGLEAYKASNDNVWAIIDQYAEEGRLEEFPKLMFACGEEDALLYEFWKEFKAHAQEIGLEAKWFSLPKYKHEWRFWDIAIEEALDFFGLTNTDAGNPF